MVCSNVIDVHDIFFQLDRVARKSNHPFDCDVLFGDVEIENQVATARIANAEEDFIRIRNAHVVSG